MDVLSQLQQLLTFIDSADPNSWLNIPQPIIYFLSNLQQVIKLQSKLMLKNNTDIQKLSTSLDKKFTKLSNAISSPTDISSMIDLKCTEVLKTVDSNLSDLDYKIVTQYDRKLKEEGEWVREKLATLENIVKTRLSMVHGQIDSTKDTIIEHIKTKALPEVLNKFSEDNNRKLLIQVNSSISELSDMCYSNDKALQEILEKNKELKIDQIPHIVEGGGMNEGYRKDIENRFVAIENNLLSLQWKMETECQKLSKMIDSNVETAQEEIHGSIEENKRYVDSRFEGVSDQVYKLVPNLISKSIVENATEKAIEEALGEVKKLEISLNELLISEVKESEKQLIQAKEDYLEGRIKSLNEKLAWLPLDRADIKNLPPDELRLYTIESKLRTEESSRLQIYDQLQDVLDMLRNLNSDNKVKNSDSRLSSLDRKKDESRLSSIDRKREVHRTKREKMHLKTLADFHTSTASLAHEFDNESPKYYPLSVKYEKPKINLRYIYHNKDRIKKLPKIELRTQSKLSRSQHHNESVRFTPIQPKKLEIEE